MTKSEVTDTIKETLVSVLKHGNFEMKEELTAKDVDGWDSLSHMLIISKLEKAFKIRFKLKDLNKMENMGSLISIIESKLTSN